MLNSISWQEYIFTLANLIIIYYAIAGLLLYRKELANFFTRRKPNNTSLRINAVQSDSNESNPHDNLMGKPRYESKGRAFAPDQTIAVSEEIIINSSVEEEEPLRVIDLQSERLVSDLHTLQNEISSLLEIVTQADKEETSSFFKALLANYPQFISTPYQQQLSEQIMEGINASCSFQSNIEEINTWWPHIHSDNV